MTQKTSKTLTRGLFHNTQLRQQYTENDDSTSDDSIEIPPRLPLQETPKSSSMAIEFAFVGRFKRDCKSKFKTLNWGACLLAGHKAGHFQRITTGHSLRSFYNRHRKSKK
ncbi:hypothetical protein DM01DRAFT_1333679 [Hesseltinella vesiculosa]|uniref:Uncharacterized protein n=1 Tax=Hesseltinella vesiculosa TaxID=101127 RepID=A0A1X2GNB2_9FUNG|nr:hypothetical protein DM01DRAFT_1333679 [Hesseltinella vesiculosa]